MIGRLLTATRIFTGQGSGNPTQLENPLRLVATSPLHYRFSADNSTATMSSLAKRRGGSLKVWRNLLNRSRSTSPSFPQQPASSRNQLSSLAAAEVIDLTRSSEEKTPASRSVPKLSQASCNDQLVDAVSNASLSRGCLASIRNEENYIRGASGPSPYGHLMDSSYLPQLTVANAETEWIRKREC